MDHDFWHARWQANQIGFHEGRPNPLLERFIDRLPSGGRVLVPLCGKADDLAYLASRGHTVIGVELVESAVAAFFTEHDLTPTREAEGDHVAYRAGAITVLAGDWFATTAAAVGAVDAIYDRAALIALPPPLRSRYVAHLRALAPDAPALLITLDYPQEVMDGPPFAVGDAEVRALWAGRGVALLSDDELVQPRLAALGVTGRERCYAIAA
jgi:thiopurine S-methyltransferase